MDEQSLAAQDRPQDEAAPRVRRVREPDLLDYPLAPPRAGGAPLEVAPGVLWLRHAMPIALDHINVYLLADEAGWWIVDTGLNDDATRERWEALFANELAGAPIAGLICTHFHYDHAGLATWFAERFELPVWMSRDEYFMLAATAAPPPDPLPRAQREFYRQAGLEPEFTERMFRALRSDPFHTSAPPSYRRLRAGQVLRIGGREWQVRIGSGHSPEHVCLFSAADRLLIAGDQILSRISSNVLVNSIEPEADPLSGWFDSLAWLGELPADTLVLPSHQGVFRGVRERAAQLRAHHGATLDQLREFARTGGSAAEAMRVLFPHLRRPVDHMLALGETLAHLAWLRERGEIVRERAPGAADFYRAAPDPITNASTES